MHFWEMPEQADAFAEKAMGLLRQHKIPATPHNYELWFTYAVGQNADLQRALDAAVASGKACDVNFAGEIHARFFTDARSDAIDELGSKFQEEVKRLALILAGAGQDTAAYGLTLAQVATDIGTGDVAENFKSIVDGVAAATRAMESRTKTLENQLEASAGEVNVLRERMEAVRQESMVDPLTGLANRRAFDQHISDAIDEATSEGTDLCVLMGDVDHFKKFNDTWGHATGDQVLRLVAQCFKSNLKGRDTAARYGGEEFIVILPETSLKNASRVADQIRKAVESKKIVKRSTGETLGSITLSVGVAQYIKGEPVADAINRADTCLYAAKHAGRNRVCTEQDLGAVEAATAVAAAS
ncbi:MAG: diguanylate cyclase [Alphaproteobacteria bacterium]|nr:diguanylate cyclase [Alphaproteobacteria bacterium]